MPIDPNISLGFRQPEQPNMLAQAGQMMQLRQMQRENEQTNALNEAYQSAYAGGQYDPTAVERNLASGSAAHMIPKVRQQQAALEKAQAEVKKIGYDNSQSAFAQSRQALTQIDPASPNAGAQLIAWHQANHTDPVMGPILKASGINANTSRADIEAAIAKGPAAIQTAIQRYALGQEGFQKEVMQTARAKDVANIGAAPGHRQASLAETKYADELANPRLTPVQGMMPIPDPNAPGGVRMVETFAGFNPRGGGITPSQVRAPAAPPTVANSLAAQNPAPAVNNALNPNFVTAPSSPVVPSATATVPNVSAVAPSVALPNTPAQAAMFAPKPSAQQEKQAQVEVERTRGKSEVGGVISNLASKYKDLSEKGGTTSTKKGTLENIGAYLSSTGAGQEIGKMTGAEAQSLRNEIKAQSPILLEGIKKATGMTAKELDSNADVKRWMEAMGSPTFDIQSTLGILKSLNKQFGTGGEILSAPAAAGAPDIKSLLDKYK